MKKVNYFSIAAALGMLMIMPEAYAQSSVTLSTMFANAQASFDALIKLVQFSAYIIGLFLVVGSIFKFSQLGSNHQMSPKTPIIMFCCGIGIFALTGTVSIMTATMAMGSGPGSILLPSSSSLSGTTAAAMQGVLTFIRLIGYIAFIRGWFLLNQAGQGKDGVIARGLTHIAGGVGAINVVILGHILAATFAPGMTMPF